MPRHLLRATFGLVLVMTTAGVFAADVYQWKDANGVTHFSQTPPPKGAFQTRVISSGGDAAPTPQIVAATAKESPQCATARKNIDLLQASGDLQQDTNGDGKPDKTLTADDRANQLELARATLKATCPATPLTPAP